MTQSSTTETWIPARRRRLFLALYLDWIIFSVPWGFLHYAVYLRLPGLAQAGTPAKLVFFVILELILHRAIRWSPGNYLLGIRFWRPAHSEVPVVQEDHRPFVRADIKTRESSVTLFLATLLMNEGLKSVIRWTMWTPPIPVFGVQLSDGASAAFLMVGGILECTVALLLFKLRREAIWLGIPLFLILLASTLMSWDLWDPWVREWVERRRGYQGLPVREGEIEFMQRLCPEAQVAWLLLLIILIGVSIRWVKHQQLRESAAV